MKIGILIGINSDSCSNYDLYPILEDMPDKLYNLSNYGEQPSSDISIFYNLYKKYPKKDLNILTKNDISLKKFNEYDIIFGLYDPTSVNYDLGIDVFKKYINAIKKTSAKFYPDIKFIELVASKSKWINHLNKHNIPVLDTMVVNMNKDKNYLNNQLKKIKNKGWGDFITKPDIGAYSIGFKMWNSNLKDNQFHKYIDVMKKKNLGNKLLVQRYVKEFHDFYEIRTYWINNVYKYSVGTIIDISTLGTSDEDTDIDLPENEGGSIEMSLMNKLKKMGRDVLKIMPCDTSLITRIDFGCCIDNKKICRDYFVNEIEFMPNFFCNETEFPIIDELSKNIIRICNLKK